MGQITEEGYLLKTQNEYFIEEQQFYLDIDPNWNLDPSTPDGLKTAHDSEVFGALDESGLLAYNSKDPNKAISVDLDAISAITGTFRSLGTGSNVTLNITGISGTVIPEGSLVESSIDGTQWATDAVATISGGVANIPSTCQTLGAIQADADTLTIITNTIGGWQTVTNLAVATPGTDAETNQELRIKRNLSVAKPGNNQLDNLLGEVLNTEGVRHAKTYENDTNSAAVDPVDNPHGLPPHSISVVVDGGIEEDVAFSIYIKKNPGVLLNQVSTPKEYEVQSPQFPENKKLIRYSEPIYIDIDVVVNITDDGSLPVDADQLVTDAIIEYTQGDLIPSGVGFNSTGFDIGDAASASRLYTPVNNVIGSYGNSIVTSLTVDGGNVVAVAFNEISRWTDSNITVNIV